MNTPQLIQNALRDAGVSELERLAVACALIHFKDTAEGKEGIGAEVNLTQKCGRKTIEVAKNWIC